MLLLDKPEGVSSAYVLNVIKAIMAKHGLRRRQQPKVGHGGTLDPFATGLLVVLMGHGVGLATDHLGGVKRYRATMKIGEKTSTGDAEGEKIKSSEVRPSASQWLASLETFLGQDYLQIPPMHSAKKINGKKLYEMARSGLDIEREPVLCRIHELKRLKSNENVLDQDMSHHKLSGDDALSHDTTMNKTLTDDEWKGETLEFEVTCSAGTFIRVLAEDLAERAGTVAHLVALRRLASKEKSVDQAVTIQDLEDQLRRGECWSQSPAFYPMEDIMGDRPLVELTQQQLIDLSYGRRSPLMSLGRPRPEAQLGLTYRGKVVALVECKDRTWEYRKVFLTPESPELKLKP
jgi:tRNA pseudouridine55 synthase